MKLRMLLALAAVASALSTGCLSVAITPSQSKKAFVAEEGLFSSTMYHCDATSGKPVCTPVVEKE